MAQRRALGRGLSALLGTPEIETELKEIEVDRILPSADQPRKDFDEESLNELANSMRVHGVVQPVVVRSLDEGLFQLVAGERRWRAARIAGMSRLPAIVRQGDERWALEIGLIENLQREDLNPIDEAHAYARLIAEFDLTQDEIASRVGKNRATIANTLRLLKLPEQVQQWLRENRLTTGHAKALLSLVDPGAILDSAGKIIQGRYSVRQSEELVSSYAQRTKQKGPRGDEGPDPNVQAALHALEQALGTKVSIHGTKGKGRIEIHFYSSDQMNRLYDALLHVSL